MGNQIQRKANGTSFVMSKKVSEYEFIGYWSKRNDKRDFFYNFYSWEGT